MQKFNTVELWTSFLCHKAGANGGGGAKCVPPRSLSCILKQEGWVNGFKMVQIEMIEDFHDLFECLQQGRTKDKTYKKGRWRRVDIFAVWETSLSSVFYTNKISWQPCHLFASEFPCSNPVQHNGTLTYTTGYTSIAIQYNNATHNLEYKYYTTKHAKET
jgi:hypothetical protein